MFYFWKSLCSCSLKIWFDKPLLVGEFKHTSLNYAQNFMLNLLCKKYAFYKLLKQNVSFLEVENQLSCIIYATWGNMRPGEKSTKTCICMPRKDLKQRKPHCKFLLPKRRKSISISLALFLVSVYFRKTLAEDSPDSCWVWETGSWKAKGRVLCQVRLGDEKCDLERQRCGQLAFVSCAQWGGLI